MSKSDDELSNWKKHPLSKKLIEKLEHEKVFLESHLTAGGLIDNPNLERAYARAVGRMDVIGSILSDTIFKVEESMEESDA